MTRAEAIEWLKQAVPIRALTEEDFSKFIQAVNLAITSLETDEDYQLEYERTTEKIPVKLSITEVKEHQSDFSELDECKAECDPLGISEITNKICQTVTETQEEFIFETLKPWCEEKVQQKISKRDLEQALLKYYGKNDLGVDCISREQALELYKILENTDTLSVYTIRQNLAELPSVTPQEPRKGHWNDIPKYKDIAWQCSECKHFTTMKHNYCPNCGARMVEPQESEDT